MPLVTATFSTGGSVVITDSVEVTAISALTSAIAANTVAINTTMGPLGFKTPGNVSTSMAESVAQQGLIVKALGKIEENQRKMLVAVQGLQASVETSTKAQAAVASQLNSINIMAQTMAADQLKANKFQQKVTNQALVDAGKEPVTVKADEVKAVVTETLGSMKDMSTIQLVYKGVDMAENMLIDSTKWALKWSAETKVGKFFIDAYTQGEAAVTALFSTDKAVQTVREQSASISTKQAGSSGGA